MSHEGMIGLANQFACIFVVSLGDLGVLDRPTDGHLEALRRDQGSIVVVRTFATASHHRLELRLK